MSYELSGKLCEKYNTEAVSDKFRKREFIVEKTESFNGKDYTEPIKFQLTQDRCDVLDRYNVGDNVKVNFNLKGKKWEKNDKVSYFNSLEAWKIEADGATVRPTQEPVDDRSETPDDDLPF